MKNLLVFFAILFLIGESVLASDIKAPQLIIYSENGKNFDLKNQLGKIVIVNFWVSWCGNCKVEMEILKELRNQYKSQDLEIIGISVDRKKDRDDFLRVAGNLNYPNFAIYDAKVNDFGEPNFLPMSYIIDKRGNSEFIKSSQDRALNKEDFEKFIRKYI